jgi:hypothetical protein
MQRMGETCLTGLSAMSSGVIAHIIHHLDLAAYVSAHRVSTRTRNVCAQRAASPVVVCCRNMPVLGGVTEPDGVLCQPRSSARTASEWKRRRFKDRLRCARDLYVTGYDKAPHCNGPHGAHFYVPWVGVTRLSPTHLLVQRHLSPAVLDLHHVRLSERDFLTIVLSMRNIEMLCVDASDLFHVGTLLARLPKLASLCLYSAPDSWEDTLHTLRRLVIPFTLSVNASLLRTHEHCLHANVLRQVVNARGDDGGNARGGGGDSAMNVSSNETECIGACDMRLFPSGLTHLTLLPGSNTNWTSNSNVGAWVWLEDLPELRELRSAQALPPASVLARLVPHLEKLSGSIDTDPTRYRADDNVRTDDKVRMNDNVRMDDDVRADDDMAETNIAGLHTFSVHLTEFTHQAPLYRYAVGPQLDKFTLTYSNWDRRYAPHATSIPTLRSSSVRECIRHAALHFSVLRQLSLRGCQSSIDSAVFRILCENLSCLERLRFASLCGDTFDAVNTHFLAPLTALTRLCTLDFGATVDLEHYELPSLLQLVSYRTVPRYELRNAKMENLRILAALKAFPRLTALHVTIATRTNAAHDFDDIADAIAQHGCLSILHIATPFYDRPSSFCNEINEICSLVTACVSRRYYAKPSHTLDVELAWCRLPKHFNTSIGIRGQVRVRPLHRVKTVCIYIEPMQRQHCVMRDPEIPLPGVIFTQLPTTVSNHLIDFVPVAARYACDSILLATLAIYLSWILFTLL